MLLKVITKGNLICLTIQGEKLNRNGELFIRRNPRVNVKLVDGSSLVIAVVLNNIPRGTTQVVFRGNFNKVAAYLALTLCQKGIQVISFSSSFSELNLFPNPNLLYIFSTYWYQVHKDAIFGVLTRKVACLLPWKERKSIIYKIIKRA